MGEEAGEFLPRAYLALGLCFSRQASEGKKLLTKKSHTTGIETAHFFLVDPKDAKISLNLALQLAIVRQVSAAMEPLQAALSLHGDDLHSLHLLTLLLSAQKHHCHALETLNLALSQHPDNLNLLLTKVKLEEAMFGPAAALQTCEEMLQCWLSHHDVSSHSSPSVAVSRLDAALSEVSDMSSTRRHGPPHIWITLERVWLQAGELFMADCRFKEAQYCIAEAASLFPNSHSVLLQRGRLAELRGQPDDAKGHYDEALAIHPTGERVLGRLLVNTGRAHLAEKVLRDAVQFHSTSHEAWSGLGEALQALGSSQAPDCFLTALELEASCPIRPFTIIPREL
uniref:Tetratricopeptide repeat domain 7A n=1 Tax=Oryzias sinensis TaxID=183150 RepID=A0A8C7XLE7_9TELE